MPLHYLFYLVLGCFCWFPVAGQTAGIPDSLDHYRKVLYKPNMFSDVENAHTYIEKRIQQYLEEKNYIEATYNMHFLVVYQIKMGALFEAEQLAIRALQFLEKTPPSYKKEQNLLYLNTDLGRIYRLLSNLDSSIYFYNAALTVAKTGLDSLMIINNKGNVLVDQNQFALAQKEFLKAYETALRFKDSLTIAKALDNLGYATAMAGDKAGINQMKESLRIRKKYDDSEGIYSVYRHLSQFYDAQEQDDIALEYAQQAYKIASFIGAPTFMENALMNLLRAKKDTLSQTFIHLRDSLDKNKLHERNKYAALQYNVLKEREKADALKLEQEKEKRRRITFQLMGLLVLGGGVSFISFQKLRHKRDIIQNILKAEAQISQKVHDEVANDVYHLMNKFHTGNSDKEDILDDLESIYIRTRDISRETAEVVITENFAEQLNDLIIQYRVPPVNIITKNLSETNWKKLTNIQKISVYRGVQELLINMKKHSKATVVALIFSQETGRITVDYSDNGIGSEIKNKNGLQNTGNRIKAVSGSFTFESIPNKGFRATIKI